jgi:hypothetical protein
VAAVGSDGAGPVPAGRWDFNTEKEGEEEGGRGGVLAGAGLVRRPTVRAEGAVGGTGGDGVAFSVFSFFLAFLLCV